MEMELQDYQVIDHCLCVKLPEEIDHHHAEVVSEMTDRQILQNQVNNVVFDFEATKFMDSSGIGLVMGRYRLIREWNGSVEIHNPAPSIKKVMRLAGLDRIASIHSSPPKSGTNSTKTEAKI